ncbi:MAG: ATP-binding cassette domain-containing protein [Syntrophobacterales bacterium]|nr:ATP-binding cassette domain-containing protein [Syntrophobacterales bacterium]
MKKIVVEMKNVSLIRDGKPIIEDLSWYVEENVHWVIMGPNGSGKTTLLKLLGGYLWPTEGTISVLGWRFGEIDLRNLRRQIAWVGSFLQEHIPFEQRPIEIVLSGKMGSLWLYEKPTSGDLESALKMAELVGCAHLLETPYGLLSQGEKQRILLARALATKPHLLLLDEPCVGLDIVAREHFLKVLSSLSSNLPWPFTIILVTHHLEEITSLFSKILLLKNGRVFAEGSIADVLKNGTLTGLYEVPVRSFTFNGRYYGHIIE